MQPGRAGAERRDLGADAGDAAPVEVVVAQDEVERQPEPGVEPLQVLRDVGGLADVAAEQDGVRPRLPDGAAEPVDVAGRDEVQVEVGQPGQASQWLGSLAGRRQGQERGHFDNDNAIWKREKSLDRRLQADAIETHRRGHSVVEQPRAVAGLAPFF